MTEMNDDLAAQLQVATAQRDEAAAEVESLREFVGQAQQFREEMNSMNLIGALLVNLFFIQY